MGFALIRIDHDADRHADLYPPLDHMKGDLDGCLHTNRKLGAIVGGRNAFHENQELVAAQPGNEISSACLGTHAVRHFADHLVAAGVTERFIDGLEAIDIDEEHRDAFPGSRGRSPVVDSRNRLIQPRFEAQPVGQAGQRIEHRDPARFVIDRPQLRFGALERFHQLRAAAIQPAIDDRTEQRARQQERGCEHREIADLGSIERRGGEADRVRGNARRAHGQQMHAAEAGLSADAGPS